MKVQSLAPVQLAQFANTPKLSEHDGWAALYNVEIDRGFYMLEIAPKAFVKSTGNPASIVILNQHDSWSPIGKASKFDERKEGLYMDFLLNPAVQAGAEVISNIDAGILTGLSVGFDIVKVESEKRGGEGAKGYEVDRITEARLREVSVVTFPAISGARIKASDAVDNITTFTVTDGESNQERLQEGDRVCLATFFSQGKRIRPCPQTDPVAELHKEDAEPSDAPPVESQADVEPQPEPKAELSEDQRYPGARAALERILGAKAA